MELQQQPAIYNGNPQVEDGHTKIANELLDQIINIDFTKRQYKILLFIIRKTYGWNKTSDDISRSQIVEATGLSNPHVTTTIQELLNMNVLIIGTGTHAKNYKINKHYETWRITETVIIPKTVTVTETVTITETVTENYQNGNNSLPKQYPQKTITKDNSNINICRDILQYLNEKAKSKFKDVDANIDLIKGRLKEGYTKEDCLMVIDIKCKEWIGTDFEMYLRPSTLFNKTKFSQYIGQKINKQSEPIPEWQRGLL